MIVLATTRRPSPPARIRSSVRTPLYSHTPVIMATTEASSGAGAGAGAGGAATVSLLTLPLGGRVAVVTGASGGIGAGIAKALASAGARVAIGARRLDALNEVLPPCFGSARVSSRVWRVTMPWRVLARAALQVKTAIESECAGSEVTAFKVDVTNRAEVRVRRLVGRARAQSMTRVVLARAGVR